VTQFPPCGSHSPAVVSQYAAQLSKDLFGGRLVFHMHLDLRPSLIDTNWGCLLADSGTIRRGSYSTSCGTPYVCSYYGRCVSTPRDFWRTLSGKIIVDTGADKAIDTHAGTSQSSKRPQGGPFAGLTSLSPAAAQLGCDPAPAPKGDDSTLRPRVLLLSLAVIGCSVGQSPAMRHAVLATCYPCRAPGPAAVDVRPRPVPFSSVDRQLCTLCWPALLTQPEPLAVRSRLGPQRRRRRWPMQRSMSTTAASHRR